MKRFFLALVLLVASSPVFAQSSQDSLYGNFYNDDSQKLIREIHIDALDCFDPRIPEYQRWVFRFLNKLHNKTNDSFIRRELLFKEGDYVDNDIITETERNLRKASFLGDAKIEEKIVGNNAVDLYVHTEDQWTLQFNISAGQTAGRRTYDFEVQEGNFLGLGKTLQLGYNKDVERSKYNFLYGDPQFLNSRWNFQTNYENATDGHRFATDMVRPFYSIDTRWAYGATWDSGTFTNRLHYKGKSVAEIDTDQRTGLFFAARSWGERYNKLKFGLVFDADSTLYPHPARIIFPEATTVKAIKKNLHPVDRENYQYGMIFKWDHQKFVEETYLDNFGRIEDLPDGFLFGNLLTHSSSVDQNPDYFQLHTLMSYSHQVTDKQYFSLMSDFSGHSQSDGILNNLIFNASAKYYLKMKPFGLWNALRFPRQTLAANLETTLTKDVDAPFQISLGEDEGLRGYTYKTFTGQNRILFNLEDRIFTPWNFRIIGIGLVTFMDAGYVWSGDEHLQFRDFGVSAGVGLRIGLKKSESSKVIRVDFAVPLRNQDNFALTEQKGYSISVSSGQVFSLFESLPKLFQLF